MPYPTETGWEIILSVTADTRGRAIELFKEHLGHFAASGFQDLGGGGGLDQDRDGKFIRGTEVSWIASVKPPRPLGLTSEELRRLRDILAKDVADGQALLRDLGVLPRPPE